jgi:hypothetical protein
MQTKTICTILLLFFLSAGQSSLAGDPQKPVKAVKKSSFTENKQWENRLNERQRSGPEARMVSPVSGTNIDADKIEFAWENVPATGKLFLGLLSNDNKEVFYKEVSGTKTTLHPKDILLKPGLSYWVLESEEDVLTVGKFYFKK